MAISKRKKTIIKPKPAKEKSKDVETWIKEGKIEEVAQAEPTEIVEKIRYTIDIPIKLHAKIKYECALKKSSMSAEILKLLEEKFA